MCARKTVVAVSILPALIGCASITSGTSQKLTINTIPPGAECTLTQNGVLIGHVNPTPGVIEVRRGGETIRVACVKAGFGDAETLNRPGLEAMTFGNILIGGVIGIAVDAASGANRKYDAVMNIPLAPVSAAPPAPELPSAPTGTAAELQQAASGARIERYSSTVAEFHCPVSGTLIRTSSQLSLKFTGSAGFRCGYVDQNGTERQRYAIFADGFGLVAKPDLEKLWPLSVGARVEFFVADPTAPTGGIVIKRDSEESFAVLRQEQLTVPAGVFDTFVVEWREKTISTGTEAIVTSWYAPLTGYVVKSKVKMVEQSANDPFAGSQYAGLDYEATEIVTPAVSMNGMR